VNFITFFGRWFQLALVVGRGRISSARDIMSDWLGKSRIDFRVINTYHSTMITN
jgi:hypothetical protein